MSNKHNRSYPGGSKSRVNRAGENIRIGTANINDLMVVEDWRAAHRHVLNTFQAILRNRTRGKGVIVAQRHKRRSTIVDKLYRFPRMQLSRMDDIAGCRLIFKDIDTLVRFRRDFHKARFNHRRRNAKDKYDYISAPKDTGYRGVHDVYEYDVRSEIGKRLKGLYVEIQYRTLVQHSWATAVELVGFITESQPKFQKGDKRYEVAMALASEILARAFENEKGPFPDISDRDVLQRFLAHDEKLNLLGRLKGLNTADRAVTEKRNAILIFDPSGDLEIREFRDATDALRALFQLEKERQSSDIVLVRADTSEEVRLAFKNYFSDAKDFIELVEAGCERLDGGIRSGRKAKKKRRK